MSTERQTLNRETAQSAFQQESSAPRENLACKRIEADLEGLMTLLKQSFSEETLNRGCDMDEIDSFLDENPLLFLHTPHLAHLLGAINPQSAGQFRRFIRVILHKEGNIGLQIDARAPKAASPLADIIAAVMAVDNGKWLDQLMEYLAENGRSYDLVTDDPSNSDGEWQQMVQDLPTTLSTALSRINGLFASVTADIESFEPGKMRVLLSVSGRQRNRKPYRAGQSANIRLQMVTPPPIQPQ